MNAVAVARKNNKSENVERSFTFLLAELQKK
jgi:hypothetical protein